MHFLKIPVGYRLRSHVLDSEESIINFKPAKNSCSKFLYLEAHEDLTAFTSISSLLKFREDMSPKICSILALK